MSDDSTPLKVVLCWHMHQPEYRDVNSGRYQLPWSYLHAIKDYVDMATIIEEAPGARAVVNFVPILLDQIADYAAQIRAFLTERTPIRDDLLGALASESWPDQPVERNRLLRTCLRANEERMINRFPAYRRLVDLAAPVLEDAEHIRYLGDQHLADMVTWYHLAWLGETVRRGDGRVAHLLGKERFFTLEDRLQLLEIIGELLGGVIGRYRRLAEDGRVELSMTPYAHPMIPLLLDFSTAREAVYDMSLPETPAYPGGEERARWHLRKGIEAFRKHFGFEPAGCWPAEGGVSTAAVHLLSEYGVRWTASGEMVLRNSLAHEETMRDRPWEEKLHRGFRIGGHGPACFFRDDGLSDLIGFTYYNWHGDDAVANLVHHLESIAAECSGDGGRVVSIILDGENAWESYPDNGYHFLSALYRRLSKHPSLELTTYSSCLDNGIELSELGRLIAGSWVYGTFSTWMGDADKNLGWDLLCEAKKAYDDVMARGELNEEQRRRAAAQLAVCEGSDWFWWFGGYNPAESVSDFERLFRLHLQNLYRSLGKEPPETLRHVISMGRGRPALGGVMRRGQAESG